MATGGRDVRTCITAQTQRGDEEEGRHILRGHNSLWPRGHSHKNSNERAGGDIPTAAAVGAVAKDETEKSPEAEKGGREGHVINPEIL